MLLEYRARAQRRLDREAAQRKEHEYRDVTVDCCDNCKFFSHSCIDQGSECDRATFAPDFLGLCKLYEGYAR